MAPYHLKFNRKNEKEERLFLAQCNFGVAFDRYGRSHEDRRHDGRGEHTAQRQNTIAQLTMCLRPSASHNQRSIADTVRVKQR